MGKIWLSSDFHFCHNRDFIYGPRGFDSVHDMNNTILRNFEEMVDWTDDLYILGDSFLNDNEEGMKFLKRIPGNKHIVIGNHDTNTRVDLMRDAGFDILGYATIIKYKGYSFYLSHYPTLTSNLDDDKPLNKRIINLCGHTHATNKFCDWSKGLIYHCELDAHDNKPVEIDTILQDIKDKQSKIEF